MTAEEMIQVNNERRKQLNEENRKYYENMLVYLRLSSIPEKRRRNCCWKCWTIC